MPVVLRHVFLCLALAVASSIGLKEDMASGNMQNPIRKVVTMLQNIQKKVEEEGELQHDLFEKFMCYCKKGGASLTEGIEAAQTKIPQLESDISSGQERKTQLEEDVTKHKADLAAATDAVKKATAIRQEQNAAFKAFMSEAGVNLEAVNKAVAALTKGMGGSFLQSGAAQLVQKLAIGNTDLSDEDKQDLMAFLSSTSAHAYSPNGGEVVGILKELARSLDSSIGEASRTEAADSKEYDELVKAKNKEIASLTEAIRTKTQRTGELAVSLVEMKEDLESTQSGLANDLKFAANMKKSCGTKEGEYKKESETRQQELLAIADTIKILNDDESLALFKKTLPSSASSFMQVTATASTVRHQVAALLRNARSVHAGAHTELDLLVLALHGEKMGFDKIVAKIDALVDELKKGQDDDDTKRVYCGEEFDKAEDESKSLERSISDTEARISDETETLSSVAEDLALLDEHIKTLDKETAEATEQRKKEHDAYVEQMAENAGAKQLLELARNRLQKFYAASLVQTVAQDELGDAQPSPPEVPTYKKKTGESNGVLAMLGTLIADIESDIAAMETEEKDAQADYQALIMDAKEKRAKDSKALMKREKMKAETKSKLGEDKGDKRSLTNDLMTNEERIASLHKACDWLLKNYDARKSARSAEMENLKNAKYVLAGTEASLLQARSHQFLSRVA